MWIQNFFKSLTSSPARRRIRPRRPASRLGVESLEDRTVPAFLAPVDYQAESWMAPVTADFDGDGRLDLATVGSDYLSTLSVLLGNGDGTFQPARTSSIEIANYTLVVGDFNGDGKPDLTDGVNVHLGNGDGTFGSPIWLFQPRYAAPVAVAVGDLNSDGKADLVGVGWDMGEESTNVYGWVAVWLGNGDGTFASPWAVWEGQKLTSVALADFDGDGRLDAAASGLVLLGNGDGTLRLFGYAGRDDGSVGVADFNSDGKPDLAVIDSSGLAWIELGNGDGTFQPYRPYSDPGAAGGPMALADFNGDGKPDLARTNAYSSEGSYQGVEVLLGNGDGTLQSPPTRPDNRYVGSVLAADFNDDGSPDLATARADAIPVLINDQSWPPLGAPSVSINDVTITEGNSGSVQATFTVTLSAAYSQPVTVPYTTADGTATAGSDYQAQSGTLTFAPGETSKTVTVLVNGDTLVEDDEVFTVYLSSAVGATIADGQGTGTIINDDVPPPAPTISIGDVTKAEGRKGQKTLFTFTVTLSADYDQPVTISYRTVNGTATTGDKDYVAKSGTITFAPGETTKTITITVKGDSKREADEVFYLDLSDPSGQVFFEKSRGVGMIVNDD